MSRRPVVTVSAVALLVLVVTLLITWQRLIRPSDGTVVQLSNGPWQSERLNISDVLAPDTGMRDGDLLTAIEGERLPGANRPSGGWREGDAVTYRLLRGGESIDVTVALRPFPVSGFLARNWPAMLAVLILAITSVTVFAIRPRDPAAQALLLLGSFTTCGTVAWLLGEQAYVLAVEGFSALDVAGEVILTLIWGALLHFTFSAPGVPAPLGRRGLAYAYLLPFILHAGYLIGALPSASDPGEMAGRLAQVSLAASTVLPAGVVIVLVRVYRLIEEPVARRRMRWVLVTLMSTLIGWPIIWSVPHALGYSAPPDNLVPLLFVPPTLALAAAILRYRLFDIELILRRSLLYGTLTVTLLTGYLALAWLLSQLPLGPPDLSVILAGGLIGLTAPPLRNLIRHRIGRLVYGARDDPFDVVSRLGNVDTVADPQAALADLTATLARLLRLPYVAVELRAERSRFSVSASHGEPAHRHQMELPLPLGDGVLGRLTLAVAPGREPFGPADRRLLDALTQHVRAAASMVLLTNELQRSREHIVSVREEERRTHYRELHDRVGARLSRAIKEMQFAQDRIGRNDEAALAALDELVTDSRRLIRDVRELVIRLRPPALDQLGLPGALQERAARLVGPHPQTSIRIRVEQRGTLTDLPAAVEVAAFQIVVEAMSNAVRHSGASQCDVLVHRVDDGHLGTLTLDVRDDGACVPSPVEPGRGLIIMHERAEELGGSCDVRIGHNGTLVRAVLPFQVPIGAEPN